jgi:hypothetical protein
MVVVGYFSKYCRQQHTCTHMPGVNMQDDSATGNHI